jgi:tetratricopeptide (TPR) repeat protein
VRAKSRTRLNKIQREAEGYLELGLAQQALNALGRLGNPADTGATTLYLWGESLRALGRFDEAIGSLRQAAKAEPENVHIWLALGWCHKRTNQLDLAIDDLENGLTADPGDPLLHYNLACYLSLARNKLRALDHLSRALALDSRYRHMIDGEPDFDPLRSDPDFQALTNVSV